MDDDSSPEETLVKRAAAKYNRDRAFGESNGRRKNIIPTRRKRGIEGN